ncbi:peptidoglycan-binding protein [Microvirga pudoricolor]|uniref:peptidoglycan-binding protein n=1 Tax=Microvirga pudoricolor TaxID=2778729 RepID=UPI00194EAAC6|nr:peptidoglycan-binding protein [Microvirga pudoricolor]MBM6596728.1 peptidoglycan-binding protein [Microvirga pudoricolor]
MSRSLLSPHITLMLALMLPTLGLAQGLPAAPATNSPLDAARGGFEALADPDRKAVQEALIWTGDYSGMADGSFGRQTFEAIGSFQQRNRQPATGILSSSSRAALLSAAQQAKAAAGFTVLDDPKSGARIGIPTKILPKQEANQSGGSRWQSADGKVTLDTRVAPPDATLQAIFDRNIAIQAPGRVVSYKIIRPDFFVIAGETATGKFYTRYASGASGLRAFSIGYDKALAPSIDRIVVAVANSFVPFPPAVSSGPAIVAQPSPAPAPAAPPTAGPRLLGTGLATGPRQLTTTAPLQGCANLLAGGLKPSRVSGQDAVVMEFATDLKAQPRPLSEGTMTDGADVLILAFTQADGAPRLTVARGTALGERRFSAPLQPGASGAPVLDAAGRLIGLVAPLSGDPRRIAGVVPVASYGIVPVPGATGAGTPPQDKRSTADMVDGLRGALVPILCN